MFGASVSAGASGAGQGVGGDASVQATGVLIVALAVLILFAHWAGR